jgi:hypothetical protein
MQANDVERGPSTMRMWCSLVLWMVSEMTRSDPNSQHGGQSVGGMATGLCHYRGVSSSCAVLAMACLS